jgi:hypothetical protein
MGSQLIQTGEPNMENAATRTQSDFKNASQVESEVKTLPVPEAGKRYFGLGRNASYEAARRGDLPVIKIGSRLRVSVTALEQMLADAGRRRPTPSDASLEVGFFEQPKAPARASRHQHRSRVGGLR